MIKVKKLNVYYKLYQCAMFEWALIMLNIQAHQTLLERESVKKQYARMFTYAL
jgi:hypothetical protein